MRRLLALALAPMLVLGCSAFAQPAPGGTATSDTEKIDPSLKIEVKRLIAEDRSDQSIEVILRSRGEINPAQRAAIEQKGGILGSVIGNIATARIPAKSVPEVARFDWILYVEKAKKHRAR